MSKIAEGFDRGSRPEFHKFLVIAKGSCAEVRSQLYVALDCGYGDPAKAKEKLGWIPKTTFDELVAEMVREDIKSAERNELVKHHGYKAMDYQE